MCWVFTYMDHEGHMDTMTYYNQSLSECVLQFVTWPEFKEARIISIVAF